MDFWLLVKAMFLLGLLVAFILLLAKVGQVYLKGRGHLPSQGRQLKVTERFALDTKRNLVRFQDHRHTYLVLLGQQGELLLNKEISVVEKSHDSPA